MRAKENCTLKSIESFRTFLRTLFNESMFYNGFNLAIAIYWHHIHGKASNYESSPTSDRLTEIEEAFLLRMFDD